MDKIIVKVKPEEIEAKLHRYASQCHRYSLPKIQVIQNCIESSSILNLDNYAIGSTQCQITFETFAMIPLTSLTEISMRNNHLESFCCHAMSAFIKLTSSLKELTLDGCKFDDEGAEILSEGVAISKSINRINFSNCNISDDGGEFLAKSFLTNNVCTDLVLSFNTLSLKFAKVFKEVMINNKTLVKLDLSHNALYEDFAVVDLLKGLSENETLESLDFSWNSLRGEPFGKALPKAIKLSSLKVLNMTNNRLSKFEFKKLAFGLRRSKTIEKVFLEGNMFASGDDVILVNVFNSDSPLNLLSFGKLFQLSQEAFQLMQNALQMKRFEVIFQGLSLPNPPRQVNMLDIFADRVKHLAMAPKKKLLKRDMRIFMTRLKALEDAYLTKPEFIQRLTSFKVKLDDELVKQYTEAYAESPNRLNIHLMANHFLNRHPYTP